MDPISANNFLYLKCCSIMSYYFICVEKVKHGIKFCYYIIISKLFPKTITVTKNNMFIIKILLYRNVINKENMIHCIYLLIIASTNFLLNQQENTFLRRYLVCNVYYLFNCQNSNSIILLQMIFQLVVKITNFQTKSL